MEQIALGSDVHTANQKLGHSTEPGSDVPPSRVAAWGGTRESIHNVYDNGVFDFVRPLEDPLKTMHALKHVYSVFNMRRFFTKARKFLRKARVGESVIGTFEFSTQHVALSLLAAYNLWSCYVDYLYGGNSKISRDTELALLRYAHEYSPVETASVDCPADAGPPASGAGNRPARRKGGNGKRAQKVDARQRASNKPKHVDEVDAPQEAIPLRLAYSAEVRTDFETEIQ